MCKSYHRLTCKHPFHGLVFVSPNASKYKQTLLTKTCVWRQVIYWYRCGQRHIYFEKSNQPQKLLVGLDKHPLEYSIPPEFMYMCANSGPAFCDPVDCSPPGSSLHGISQARILERVAMLSSRGSSRPRDWALVSCIAGRFFTTRDALLLTVGNDTCVPTLLLAGFQDYCREWQQADLSCFFLFLNSRMMRMVFFWFQAVSGQFSDWRILE